MAKKELKMRKLKTTDVFKMSRILSKIDIDFKKLELDGMSQEQAGMAVVKLVLENVWRAEDEVNEFLGNLVGLSGEEFGELELEETLEVIKQFQNQKGIVNFFKSAIK